LKPLFDRHEWGRILIAVAGSAIYALGINLFLTPCGLYTGGLIGISQLLRSLLCWALHIEQMSFDLTGVIYYLINIPLLFLGYRLLSREFFVKTLIVSTSYTVFMSLVPVIQVLDDLFVSCLVGGVMAGFGTGLVLTCGCCGGGLDVLGMCLAQKQQRVTVGQFNLVINAMIFVLCGILFSVQTMIYSVISMVFQSFMMDRTHQQSVGTQMLIFTKSDMTELDQFILKNLHRGITRWEGVGAYTGDATHVICVCLSKYETRILQQKLREFDPQVFFIIQEGVRMSNNFERHLC
jgi:uncharacterized membrane-anchored protein YitT (DUF2179 family)